MGGLAGVDGCRGGWLMVRLGPGGDAGTAAWSLAPRWAELGTETLDFVAVDMPVGLAEAGRRTCDGLARRLLPGAASTVFPPPTRPLLAVPDYPTANEWGKARGAGLSKQAWNLMPRIRELDAAIAPADQTRVRETHPELVFRLLAGRDRLPPKKSPEGRDLRRALLAEAGFSRLAEWRAGVPRRLAAEDDFNDACALALAARRMARGEAVRLPAEPERDARGLDMAIWY